MNTLLGILMSVLSYTYTVVDIWPDGPQESNELKHEEVRSESGRISYVSNPQMSVLLPSAEKNTGAAIILCPGGGYFHQATQHEGFQFAEWLCDNGIAAIVLKYRLPNGHHQIPGKDALQSIKLVRENAEKWHIDPSNIGIAGFSAGGHLASTAGTHFQYLDSINAKASRPDFMILFYPVITMKMLTHGGSKKNLLGDNPSQELIDLYSNELQVSEACPPTLLLLSDDDRTVPAMNSVLFYQALKQHKVPASMHIYPEGGHGWGFRESFRYHESMKSLVLDWLNQQKFIGK